MFWPKSKHPHVGFTGRSAQLRPGSSMQTHGGNPSSHTSFDSHTQKTMLGRWGSESAFRPPCVHASTRSSLLYCFHGHHWLSLSSVQDCSPFTSNLHAHCLEMPHHLLCKLLRCEVKLCSHPGLHICSHSFKGAQDMALASQSGWG